MSSTQKNNLFFYPFDLKKVSHVKLAFFYSNSSPNFQSPGIEPRPSRFDPFNDAQGLSHSFAYYIEIILL